MTALAATLAPRLVERNVRVYRRSWLVIVSGFFEPLFYLFSLGIGLGHFVGHVHGVDYASFVAPALLASSAMNGAYYDCTNVFWRLRYARVYDAVLSTPLGAADVAVAETAWALFRGVLYSGAFLVTAASLGLVHSWWTLAALPAAAAIGYAFAGVGMAAMTWMRGWQDFDILQLAILPMFLFSATFYPLSVYPYAIQVFVRLTPLYHGIHLLRSLMLGSASLWQLGDVAYLVVMGTLGLVLAGRRIARLLLS